MDNNSPLLQTLLYFVPAALVLGACYLMVKRFLDNESKLKLIELKKGMQKETLPLRFQAYERLILLLERITPNNLLVRVNRNGATAREIQIELITTIRAEFDHNLTQQLYVSSQAWEVTRNAKEDVIKIIKIAMAQLAEKNMGMDLNKAILEIILKNEIMPTQKAIEFLKREARQLYA